MKIHAAAALGAAFVLSSTLGACAAFEDSATSADGVQVAAAFYPLQYVADRVAADHASVVNLTSPGSDSHDLELTAKETADIADADLVVFQHGFQPSVDEAVETNAGGATLDVADVVELQPATGAHDHDHEDEHAEEEHAEDEHAEDEHAEDEHAEDEHAEDEHAEDEHAEDEHAEEEHDHGDEDPHFWQDPLLMADLGDAVADELAEIDPDHADDYRANAEDLRADLEALDAAYTDGLAQCAQSTVVVSHNAFGYLTRYGLEFESIAGLNDPEAEPTPADLAHLQEVIEHDGITTVFYESLVDPDIAEQLASDTGVDTAVLDPIEGLSDETAGEDYLSLMEQNLTALEEANGC